MDDVGDVIEWLPGPGAGFGMDDPECFGSDALDDFVNFFRGEDFAVGAFDASDFCTEPFSNFGHAPAEDAIDAGDHPIAWFDEVNDAGFHAGTAGSADGHGHGVGRLKHLSEHGLEFVHDTEEAGVEVSDGGSGESGEHGGVDRTGAGSHEKTLRGLDSRSDHGSPEKWGPGVISGRIGVKWGCVGGCYAECTRGATQDGRRAGGDGGWGAREGVFTHIVENPCDARGGGCCRGDLSRNCVVGDT